MMLHVQKLVIGMQQILVIWHGNGIHAGSKLLQKNSSQFQDKTELLMQYRYIS